MRRTGCRPYPRHVRLVPVLLATVLLAACGSAHREPVAFCTSGSVVLALDQAANAATIAAVGKRMGLPDHAVTIALATALQESGLRNLTYGDRDSLGLFQQRPSQGWGSPALIRTPSLSAASFYRHLVRVPRWQVLSVTAAAQKVQRSAAPEAYGQWEVPARQLARALTGERPGTFSCAFRPVPRPGARAALAMDAARELGPGGLGRSASTTQQWTAASWLVGRASSYGVSEVWLAGRTWTARGGVWKPNTAATTLTWS